MFINDSNTPYPGDQSMNDQHKTQKDFFNQEYQPVQRELPFPTELSSSPEEYTMKERKKNRIPRHARRFPKVYRYRRAIKKCWKDPLYSAANAEGLISEILPELARCANYIRDNSDMVFTEAFQLDDRFLEVPSIVARILVTGKCSISPNIFRDADDLPVIAYELVFKVLGKILRSQRRNTGWDPTLAM